MSRTQITLMDRLLNLENRTPYQQNQLNQLRALYEADQERKTWEG